MEIHTNFGLAESTHEQFQLIIASFWMDHKTTYTIYKDICNYYQEGDPWVHHHVPIGARLVIINEDTRNVVAWRRMREDETPLNGPLMKPHPE